MKKFIGSRQKVVGDIIISALLLLVCALNLLTYVENKIQDAAFQRQSVDEPEVVVFGIDRRALDEFGRIQDWSRQHMADAINILNSSPDYRPAVIAIDILYASESGEPQADAALAQAALDGGNVVVASLAYFGDELIGGMDGDISIDAATRRVVAEVEKPYPALERAAVSGIVSTEKDDVDGLIRRARIKAPYGDEMLYSFPVEIYKMYTGGQTGDYIDKHNFAYIAYTGLPGHFYGHAEYGHSFADIFADDFDPEEWADCIVMIGPYAPGMMDAYSTPIDSYNLMYGVEIHANVVQMLLDGNFKTYAPAALNFTLALAAMLLAMALVRLFSIRILLAVFAALGAGYYFIAVFVFGKGLILTILYPLLSLAVIYIYQVVYGYILETIEKRKLRNAFGKYVDPKLVEKLIESGEANSNEVGAKKNIAVLFVDVRGFTPMTEALKDQPDLVVKILNEYLELTSGSVFNNDGSVDKFVGDATMALFNGFFPTDDYIFKAVKAAWDMVQGAVRVNSSIKEKYGVDVGFGIGVNCGAAIVGNLGPSFRKDYTAIGDTVNTAARLESNAKRSEVLISKDVYDVVKDRVEAESVGEIPLKGKSVKLEVFSVKDVKS